MKSKLAIVTELARAAGYNEQGKAEYKRLALSVLREIARKLNLPRNSYSIRFNPGGIAVAGDAILHHDAFYLTTSETGVMWRTCKGRSDYSGGVNRWAHGFGESLTVDELTEQIRLVLDASVAAAATLSRSALTAAAKEGAALGTCDED